MNQLSSQERDSVLEEVAELVAGMKDDFQQYREAMRRLEEKQLQRLEEYQTNVDERREQEILDKINQS